MKTPGAFKVRPRNLGASVWLDGIPAENGSGWRLPDFLKHHDVTGVRFRLPMFEEAISKGDRKQAILAGRDLEAPAIYSTLLAADIREIAAQLEPLFDESEGREGLVALPLPAELSYDLEALVEDAVFLWTQLEQKNLILLVPATDEGVRAFQNLIAAGINAGVTQLFSMRRYRQVCEAYLTGLEQRVVRDADLRHVSSIAEFALGFLDHMSGSLTDSTQRARKEMAVATARAAYGWYLHTVGSSRFQTLARAGARAQRLAWSAAEDGSALLSRTTFPDEVIGPATVCELPADSICTLEGRSIAGVGIQHDPFETAALEMRCEYNPELEMRSSGEMERMIRRQVVRTDQAIASIKDQLFL